MIPLTPLQSHPRRAFALPITLFVVLGALVLASHADAHHHRHHSHHSHQLARPLVAHSPHNGRRARDTTPPDTTISSGPSGTITTSSAAFAFTSSESGSTFACRLDSAAFAACKSPSSYSGLADGSHTFSVRATDAAGNTDASPATRSFTVSTSPPPPTAPPPPPPDTTPPDTTISSGPSGTITTSSTSFTFTSSESGSSFACSLDSAAFAGCSSPHSDSGLADGSHTFSVRATDSAGNTDPSPATRSFTVSTAPAAPPPSSPVPATWRRSASFESDLNAGVDFWRVDSPFTVSRTNEVGGAAGGYAAKIVTNGGNSSCSCPRMGYQDGFSYGPGSDIWMGGSWYMPDPSKLAWSRLMNLGHYESGSGSSGGINWYLALESTDAGTWEVSYSDYGGSGHHAILPERSIPANQWVNVDLHFVLSPVDGQALTEWYINGKLVGSSTKANMFNSSPLWFYNGGLPYFWPGNGNTTVYFDNPRLTS